MKAKISIDPSTPEFKRLKDRLEHIWAARHPAERRIEECLDSDMLIGDPNQKYINKLVNAFGYSSVVKFLAAHLEMK